MTDLRLKLVLTGDAAGLTAATKTAEGSVVHLSGTIEGLGDEAKTMARDLDAGAAAITAAGGAATAATRQVEALGGATKVVRSAFGSLDAAAATASIGTYGAALAGLRSRYDPLFAASTKYQSSLAAVRAAHAAGAIDARTLISTELELKAAYDQVAAAADNRARAGKLAAQAMVDRQTIVPDRAGDIAAYGAQLDALRAKYNPLWAAGQQYKATLGEIRQAERVGAISTAEAAAAITRAKAATQAQVAAIRGATGAHADHAQAMKLSGLQATQLSYQLNDVFVSLASGQNPMMVAIQQGSQIGQIFGGVGNAVRAGLQWLTPFRIGVGVLGGLFLVGAKSALDYAAATREADVAARGVGRTAGTSAGEISLIAQKYARAGDVSIDRARSMATEFTKTGRIGSEQFGRLITIAKDFSGTIGTDVETGTKQLAEIMSDPARGAETLSKSLNLVDESVARTVVRLTEQGEVSKAQTTLLDALDGRLVKYGDTVAWYTKLWEDLVHPKTSGSIGDALAPKTAEQELASLEARYKSVLAASDNGKKEIPGLGMNVGAWIEKAESTMAALQRVVDRADRSAASFGAKARIDRAGAMAIAVSDRSPVNDELMRRIALERDLEKLRKGQGAAGNTAAEEERIARGIEAGTRAKNTWITEEARAIELQRIDLALAAARDPITRAELEAERVRITLRGQVVSATQAATAETLAYARAIGEAMAQAGTRVADLTAEAVARRRVNDLVAAGRLSIADVDRELQIEAETRHLVAAAAGKQGDEYRQLMDRAAGLRAAYEAVADQQKRSSAQQAIASGRDRLETLRAEIALVGQSEAVRTRVLALLEAEQKIRAEGLQGTPEADRMRALAEATAAANTALERQRGAWDEIKSTGGSAIDTVVEGLRTGKDFSKQLGDDITKELLKLTVTNPLKNWAFGGNAPEIGDVAKTLFGGRGAAGALETAIPSAVGTATINAGTVMINGTPIGSGLGFADGTGGAPSAGAVVRSALPAVNDNGGNARVAGAWGMFRDGPRADIAGLRTIYSGRAGGLEGLDPDFAQRLSAFTAANPGVSIQSAYRSPEHQKELWDAALKKYGSADEARRWVAPPGHSQHNAGMAADLAYSDPSVAAKARESAGRFGLTFPLSNENWHVEPIGARAGQVVEAASTKAAGAIDRLTTSSTDASAGMGSLTKSLDGLFGGGASGGASSVGSGQGLLAGLGDAFKDLFGTIFKGFGSAFQGLFGGLFADGAAFSAGSVVSSATAFGMSSGRVGIMGEAGPEAVMPLTRTRDGRLGVAAHVPQPAPMRLVVDNSAGRASQPAGGGNVTVNVIDQAGGKVETRERRGADGSRQIDVLVQRIDDHMANKYGLQEPVRRR